MVKPESGGLRDEGYPAHPVRRYEWRAFLCCAVYIGRYFLPVPVQLFGSIRIVVNRQGDGFPITKSQERSGKLTVVGCGGEQLIFADFNQAFLDAEGVIRFSARGGLGLLPEMGSRKDIGRDQGRTGSSTGNLEELASRRRGRSHRPLLPTDVKKKDTACQHRTSILVQQLLDALTRSPVQCKVTFPAFQIFTLHPQQKAEQAQLNAAEANRVRTLSDVSAQVKEARALLDGARSVAQNTPVELDAARQSERQQQARYQSGLATVIEVSAAESALAQAEGDDAVARLSVWRGLAGVAEAEGDLSSFLQLLQKRPWPKLRYAIATVFPTELHAFSIYNHSDENLVHCECVIRLFKEDVDGLRVAHRGSLASRMAI